jgi:hypothetical protein
VRYGHRSAGAPSRPSFFFFFSDSVQVLFKQFPPTALGVILFLTGAQLARGSGFASDRRGDRFVAPVSKFATSPGLTWRKSAES